MAAMQWRSIRFFRLGTELAADGCTRKLALVEGGCGAVVHGARNAGIACTLPAESDDELLAAAYAERYSFLVEEPR